MKKHEQLKKTFTLIGLNKREPNISGSNIDTWCNFQRSNRFKSMLEEIQLHMDETTLHRLRTYLNMPMERIPKYKVFLQELMECTDDTHMDYIPLQSSIAAVNRVVQMIQDNIVARDNARKLRQVEFKYSLKPEKDRQFITEGLLRKVCRHTVKVYHVVLFNNALFAFKFLSNHKSFLLITETAQDQIRWLAAIQDEIGRIEFTSRLSVSSVDENENNNEADLTIKSGWLPVKRGKKWKRMWVTVDYQNLSFASSFQTSPEVQLVIQSCEIESVKDSPSQFRVIGDDLFEDSIEAMAKEFILDALNDRDEWTRAINHCIQSCASSDLVSCSSSVSEPSTGYAPIYMFGAKNCTICSNKFAFHRTRHHCKYAGDSF
ncbi:unnamed protein product [Aphanomyces euteiches]